MQHLISDYGRGSSWNPQQIRIPGSRGGLPCFRVHQDALLISHLRVRAAGKFAGRNSVMMRRFARRASSRKEVTSVSEHGPVGSSCARRKRFRDSALIILPKLTGFPRVCARDTALARASRRIDLDTTECMPRECRIFLGSPSSQPRQQYRLHPGPSPRGEYLHPSADYLRTVCSV